MLLWDFFKQQLLLFLEDSGGPPDLLVKECLKTALELVTEGCDVCPHAGLHTVKCRLKLKQRMHCAWAWDLKPGNLPSPFHLMCDFKK